MPQIEQELTSYLIQTLPSGCKVISAFDSGESNLIQIENPILQVHIFSDRMDDVSMHEPEMWTPPQVYFKLLGTERVQPERMPFVMHILHACQVAQKMWAERMAVAA